MAFPQSRRQSLYRVLQQAGKRSGADSGGQVFTRRRRRWRWAGPHWRLTGRREEPQGRPYVTSAKCRNAGAKGVAQFKGCAAGQLEAIRRSLSLENNEDASQQQRQFLVLLFLFIYLLVFLVNLALSDSSPTL